MALLARGREAQSLKAEAGQLAEEASLTEERYRDFFRIATLDSNSGKGHDPYPFQIRLAIEEKLPELIDIPTGLGKTDAVVLA
jgi:hypothetical protein